MAYLFVALGDFDESLRWLEKEYRERGKFLAFINTDPIRTPIQTQDSRLKSDHLSLRRTRIPYINLPILAFQ